MYESIETYVEEKVRDETIKTVINLLRNEVSADLVARAIPSLSLDFIKAFQRQFV